MNLVEAMEAAVAERGEDWRYPQDPAWRGPHGDCRYALADGKPACLIGVALDKMGYDVTQLSGVVMEVCTLISEWQGLPAEFYEKQYTAALMAAQDLQDSGRPWGDALAAFKRRLP